MEAVLTQLRTLLLGGQNALHTQTEAILSARPAPGKWSKKEVLGHLIDSGLNNLQRFVEIQYKPLPYSVRRYDQDRSVAINRYQEADTQEMLRLWLAVNERILRLLESLDPETLAHPLQYESGENADFRFLIEDYVAHMAHHLEQIKN